MRKANYQKIEMKANNEIFTDESIERFVERATTTQQPIEGGAPEIFTDRKDGVLAEFNIRTDRFEIALNAMDKASKSITAKRQEIIENREQKLKENLDKTETQN